MNIKIDLTKSYPVILKPNGNVRIELPIQLQRLKSTVIYDFFNTTNDKHLRGQTTGFYSRMKSGYQTDFNEKENPREITQDIQKGHKVRVTILKIVGPTEDADQLETDAINEIPKQKRYNIRSGGGGGTKETVKASETTPRTKQAILQAIQETYTSPAEKATLSKSPNSGRVRINASKEFKKSTKKVDGVYKFTYKGDPTQQNAEKKVKPGKSDDMWKRIQEHRFYIENAHNPKYKKVTNQLYKDALRSPSKIEIKAIKTQKTARRIFELTGKTPSGSQLESGYIQYFDSQKTGYSKTSGGNGPSSKKK